MRIKRFLMPCRTGTTKYVLSEFTVPNLEHNLQLISIVLYYIKNIFGYFTLYFSNSYIP